MPELTLLEQALRRIRLLIEEGRESEGIAALDTLQPANEEEKKKVNYLYSWYYNRKERWEDAARSLSYQEDANTIEEGWIKADHSERERRAMYLLLLGNAALDLAYFEDAIQHYMQCLRILELRRVRLPNIRVQTLMGLGTSYLMLGMYAAATQSYEEAIRVCQKEKLQESHKVMIADLYYGLSDAHRQAGHFEQALLYGRRALEIYREVSNRPREGRIQNVLGRIAYQLGDFQAATNHYMESLSIAALEHMPWMQLINFAAMADLFLVEERLDDATRYILRAEQTAEQIGQVDHQYLGQMYMIHGQIIEAEALKMQGQEQCQRLKDALSYYQQAEGHFDKTQDRKSRSELFGHLAQVYEHLQRPAEALAYWKSACQLDG